MKIKSSKSHEEMEEEQWKQKKQEHKGCEEPRAGMFEEHQDGPCD